MPDYLAVVCFFPRLMEFAPESWVEIWKDFFHLFSVEWRATREPKIKNNTKVILDQTFFENTQIFVKFCHDHIIKNPPTKAKSSNPPALRLLSVVACGGALGNGSGAIGGNPWCLGASANLFRGFLRSLRTETCCFYVKKGEKHWVFFSGSPNLNVFMVGNCRDFGVNVAFC